MFKHHQWSAMSPNERAWLSQRGSAHEVTTDLSAAIAALVADVAERGDAAVCQALADFDGVTVAPDGLAVTPDEFAQAAEQVPTELHDAIATMIANIRGFNEALAERRQSWTTELASGHVVGEQIGPVESAALFCPSGKASYPSVLAQVATPAVVAGVPDLIVLVPPVPGGTGEIDPAVLVVAQQLGLDRVFRVNGPAGVAAATYGTEHIPKVGTIIGPGSPPVALAQLEARKQGVNTVVLGPSESLIIADSSADPDLLAADLLNEAEHGTDSTVLLVSHDAALIAAADAAATTQAQALPDERRHAVEAALGSNGGAIEVASIDEAFEVANWFAPEHLQLAVSEPWEAAQRIEHAGEVLIGQTTPISAGNFVIGAPAALPTGGYAKAASGVTIEAFQKATSVGHLTDEALARVARATVVLAEHEGFPAHARAITMRDERRA